MTATNDVILYTDGACDPNPGTGGWGVVILEDGRQRTLSGGELNTTNNRMELTAAIKGLQAFSQPAQITVYCDSEYVKRGITEWITAWKKKNWKRQGGALANVELWQTLDKLNTFHQVRWLWVKGHASNPHNQLADQLAVAARKKLQNK
jgi:ribonuclease HI